MLPRFLVCVGSGGTAGDIQVFFPDADGRLELLSNTSSGFGASYMSVHPTGAFVYVTHSRENVLSAFTVDWSAGDLRPLNRVDMGHLTGSDGAGASYASLDATGRVLLVASYRGHTVTAWRIRADGAIGEPLQSITAGTNAHCVRVDPSNTWAFATFLGSDLVAQYRFDQPTGTLTPLEPSSVPTAHGAGPRHIDFHPAKPWVFLVNELDSSVYRFDVDSDRGLVERQRVSAVPAGYEGRRWSADIHVAPSGGFLYVSNRAHDSLARFGIGPDGELALAGHQSTLGRTPRSFTFDPTGNLLLVANQDSDTVVTFAVDAVTGVVDPLQTTSVCPRPYFVAIVPGDSLPELN